MPLIHTPQLQYVDTAGVPWRFAEAYFSLTGTTTPVEVYQDEGFSIPHANPVVADALGLFPPIHFDPSLGLIRCRIITETGDLDNPPIDADPVNDVDVDSAGAAWDPGVFWVALINADITIPVKNGSGGVGPHSDMGGTGNGGWYPQFDTTLIDTHNGVMLALDLRDAPYTGAGDLDKFYSPSTGYVVPVGQAGIWILQLQLYYAAASGVNNQIQLGFSRHTPVGLNIPPEGVGGAQPDLNFQWPGMQDFDGPPTLGPHYAFTSPPIALNEGDIIRPWLIRSPVDAIEAFVLSDYHSFFAGHRVAPPPLG